MEYLKLGTIIKPRGLNGTVKVFSTSDFSSQRYKKNSKVYLRNNITNAINEMKVSDYSTDGKFDYITFSGYDTVESITPFLKNDILIIKENNPLPEGLFYHDDLSKCSIYENNVEIAKVKNVEDYNAYKSLRIVFIDSKKEFLLPFIDTFIKKVDITNKRIDVELIDGMKE